MLICELFLSVARLDSRENCRIPGYLARIQAHADAVALPAMFCPAASPVVKLNRRNRNRLAVNCSTSRRCPVWVVASAAVLISPKWALTQVPNARASRALSNPNTGARCMTSSITVTRTPPARCSSFMPRL